MVLFCPFSKRTTCLLISSPPKIPPPAGVLEYRVMVIISLPIKASEISNKYLSATLCTSIRPFCVTAVESITFLYGLGSFLASGFFASAAGGAGAFLLFWSFFCATLSKVPKSIKQNKICIDFFNIILFFWVSYI